MIHAIICLQFGAQVKFQAFNFYSHIFLLLESGDLPS